jgi:polyhydroxyalkanoate synthesis regulator phasin
MSGRWHRNIQTKLKELVSMSLEDIAHKIMERDEKIGELEQQVRDLESAA